MRIRIILLLLTILLTSCSSNISEPVHTEPIMNNPIELIDGFNSYQSIEVVKQYCDSLGYSWKIIEDSKLPKGDKRPRFDIFVTEINNYKYLEIQGTLELRFYNNRLEDIRFYPIDEYNNFITILFNKRTIDLRDINEKIIDNLRIWKNDEWDKPYIGWTDIRLEKEEWEWIEKYS